MTKSEKAVLFKVLICLLNTSAMDCLDKHSKEIKIAKAEYIKSTVKMVEELLELEALVKDTGER